MERLKFILDTVDGNNREARKYAGMILAYKEKQKTIADWCKEMASAHIAFNSSGMSVAKKLIEEIRSSTDKPEYTEGALSVWMERMAELSSENITIKAMIDSYK